MPAFGGVTGPAITVMTAMCLNARMSTPIRPRSVAALVLTYGATGLVTEQGHWFDSSRWHHFPYSPCRRIFNLIAPGRSFSVTKTR